MYIKSIFGFLKFSIPVNNITGFLLADKDSSGLLESFDSSVIFNSY